MTDYNYERFDEYVEASGEQTEFAAFFDHLHAGDRAPDFIAIDLQDGSEVRASELWKQAPLVIEFGSFT